MYVCVCIHYLNSYPPPCFKYLNILKKPPPKTFFMLHVNANYHITVISSKFRQIFSYLRRISTGQDISFEVYYPFGRQHVVFVGR